MRRSVKRGMREPLCSAIPIINMGNGAVIERGIRIASNAIWVLTDDDVQHDPDDIRLLPAYSSR
ncbi:MAG: hypothetical protein U5R49_09555 [Deltaproteobacteria bacterium]|nr:hypothetical protein [Deltaproteobacteria bacterium]